MPPEGIALIDLVVLVDRAALYDEVAFSNEVLSLVKEILMGTEGSSG